MSHKMFDVAIIGAGPGGISAAARASQRNASHVLLEASDRHANTIQQYQKGKHVMAEPCQLPLRSDVEFRAGDRESILDKWEQTISNTEINIRYKAEVRSIVSKNDAFRIVLKTGQSLSTKNIILALGVQGKPRKLNVPGEEYPFVQTSLESADAYHQETIVIVGAGDSAIENAISLCSDNRVIVINRRNDFSRAKESNMNRIIKAIEIGQIECFYETTVDQIQQNPAESQMPGRIVLNTVDDVVAIDCHRIITRLGAIPSRKLVESVGVSFSSEAADSPPQLSQYYESNVPGVYVIGALAGYPLIKQALNQGYEVIEHLLGNPVKPADHPILQEKLKALPFGEDVDDRLMLIRQHLRLFREINPLNLRELVMMSKMTTYRHGEVIFSEGSYCSTFYNILQGKVQVQSEAGKTLTLKQGQFFGESSLISDRPRKVTVIADDDCILFETPPRIIKKLMRIEKSVRYGIDQVSILRSLNRLLRPIPKDIVRLIAKQTKIHRFAMGETLFQEGDCSDHLYLLRSGSVTLSRKNGKKNDVVGYYAADSFIGLMGLTENNHRLVTAQATVATEALSIPFADFNNLLTSNQKLRDKIQKETQNQLAKIPRMQAEPERGETLAYLMDHGLGQATNVLIIDESLCIGCDNCETACATTHQDVSRLDRKAGPTFNSLHIPASCRHCEHPHCMLDCPPDAITRLESGEVVINDDTCIGCGNCEDNCPYDVIQMTQLNQKLSLFDRLLGGKSEPTPKIAVKCDMCMDLKNGPACVNACPTGAAIRIHAEQAASSVNKILP